MLMCLVPKYHTHLLSFNQSALSMISSTSSDISAGEQMHCSPRTKGRWLLRVFQCPYGLLPILVSYTGYPRNCRSVFWAPIWFHNHCRQDRRLLFRTKSVECIHLLGLVVLNHDSRNYPTELRYVVPCTFVEQFRLRCPAIPQCQQEIGEEGGLRRACEYVFPTG